MDAVFFETQDDFRKWLAANHDTAQELWIGFYKKKSGVKSITPPEALDEALCYGWIDSVRRAMDETRYINRYTPRKPGSNWSLVNIKRVNELIELGQMQPAGLKAFEMRDEEKSKSTSYEERHRPLEPAYEEHFRANQKAWAFFQSQAPSYQKAASWWVNSAKKEETRLKRLATLIEDSEHEHRIKAVP